MIQLAICCACGSRQYICFTPIPSLELDFYKLAERDGSGRKGKVRGGEGEGEGREGKVRGREGKG